MYYCIIFLTGIISIMSKNSVRIFFNTLSIVGLLLYHIIIIINKIPWSSLPYSSTPSCSNLRFAEVPEGVFAACIIHRSNGKVPRKKFHSTFRGLCPWSVLIFLSRHLPFTISASHSVFPYLLRIVSRSDFFSRSFCIPVSEECDVLAESDF